MDKPTVPAPPGYEPKRKEPRKVSDRFGEWCACIILICIAALGVAGTYRLLQLMFQ